ncbi:MAG: hypothetical protein OXE77_01565 [Flavobacteriaceae bacterium]|nr:hypothetical protein [Flavobacteriaceae bacterium]
MVPLRKLWIEFETTIKKNRTAALQFSIFSTDGLDFLNPFTPSLGFGMGLWITQGMTNALNMVLKLLATGQTSWIPDGRTLSSIGDTARPPSRYSIQKGISNLL